MEEQGDKMTGEIHRATQDDDNDRSQPDHIPLDLTSEILSRLPAKSIARFFCVSKLWSSFTTRPSFINSFASRSSLQPQRLLVTFTLQEKHFVFSFPQNQNQDGSYPPYYSYQMSNPKYSDVTLSESVQGLILLWGLVVWNPTLRRFLTLPQPHQETISVEDLRSLRYYSYLGYDPLEGKHKVLFMLKMEYTDQPRVLTLGGQESWRIIAKGRCPMHSPTGGNGRCFNGILYYEAYDTDCHRMIMSFDIKHENFSLIKFPEDCYQLPCRQMILYEGRLALVHKRTSDNYIDLYILNDPNGNEWLHEKCCLDILTGLYFKGVTAAGELVLTSTKFDTLYILYLNPRRRIMRETLFEGIVDDDLRSRYGLCSNSDIYNISVFPNHTETLVSF